MGEIAETYRIAMRTAAQMDVTGRMREAAAARRDARLTVYRGVRRRFGDRALLRHSRALYRIMMPREVVAKR